ncbi:class I SAM-dependent methyltransferase [Mucisphaera calidilacus]|uniref:Methyltransferase type 11 domain-containing protein n=1 Tax=Mucisphaera calidilacus TaxID=2527982 RepID=A0A518BUC2_9BACT|nr:class I SAM-dependent methyltransferase [Mucisphaera calidilacus]QDU70580.1 hypothetical protein Pan265_04080 [Mucisphaera calidilacus]
MSNGPDQQQPSRILRTVGNAHGRLVHTRRVQAIAQAVTPLVRPHAALLDIGCGDGTLAARIAAQVEGLSVTGLEIMTRPDSAIPVTSFDGEHIPLDDNAVDYAMMIDVLHHTDDPTILLREAARVARVAVILKDHRMERPLARLTLRFMDWVGNKPHGVTLPYNYWPEKRWRETWKQLGLHPQHFATQLGLYPRPANWIFEKGLHFIALLQTTNP